MGTYEKFIKENSAALAPITASIDDIFVADLDASNPYSLINLVPEYLKSRILQLPQDYFLLSEQQIIHRLRKLEGAPSNWRPDQRANLVRIAFWDEYDRCVKSKIPKIDMIRVHDRICPNQYFRQTFVDNDLYLLYLITPPTHYILSIKECLVMGIERMRETLSASPVNPDGSVNEKLADIQHRMFQTLDMRLNGGFTQRIDQRVLTANVSADKINSNDPLTLADIDKRIAELEAKKLQGTLPPATVPVDLMRHSYVTKDAEIVEAESTREAPGGPSPGEIASGDTSEGE